MKRKDLWLIGAILFIALVSALAFQFTKESGARLRITVDGKEYGVYSLSKDQNITIGDTNICRIAGGSVKMTEADCPDQLCIHQKAIDARGGTIVCLPNRVFLEIIDAESDGEQPDSVAS